MSYASFEKLEVWKRACQLNVNVYGIFRECRDYSYRDQITRAALSIPSNIAEGAERDSAKEYKRFLFIAKGSAGELRTQIYLAQKIGLIDSDTAKPITNELKEISKMLHGLIHKVIDND